MLKKTLLALFLLPLACDEVPPPAVEDVELRDWPQDPEVLYLTQYEFAAGVQEFAKLATACQKFGDPKLAVTYTKYPPQYTHSTTQVIGLGFSADAPFAVAECYKDIMLKLGAHP